MKRAQWKSGKIGSDLIYTRALTKESRVPLADIDRAIRQKEAFERDPTRHRYEEEVIDG